MNCSSSSTVAPPAEMAAPRLHRSYHCFSSHSLPFLYNPRPLKHRSFIIPQNPSKTSISFLKISLQNNRKSRNYFASASQNPDSQQQLLENKRLEEAREAISEYLEQLGASRDDASQICSNCPKYLQMLIDGVDDLDNWNSWSTAAGPGQDIVGDASEFKNKVYQMAKQKGDKGILPFLESLGLSLSSATRLARYLSSSGSNYLPYLIHKVKYLKEILFSDGDDHELFRKNARRMMAHLSISTDEDVQQTLAFFEKIQARRGGLNLLASEDNSFRYLIESFPRLLIMRIESRVKPLVKFLEDIGVPKERIRNILLLFPPIFSYNIEKDIKPRLQSFEKIGAKDELGKMLVKYPWIISACVVENFEKILVFFNDKKVPKHCSSRAIKKWPHILGCSVNKVNLMVELFEDMCIRNRKLGHIIATSPQLLLQKPQEFAQVVSFFKDLGLEERAIARTLIRCPEIFATSIDNTLVKKLDFLSEVGVSKTHLPRVIRKYPELFVCDVDKALLPRVTYLMRNGLSKRDIGFMLRRFSPLLGYSIEEVLRPKLEFLVRTMGRPVREVVDYPRYFSYSLEKKIKPRYWTMKARNIEFTLQDMLGKNAGQFNDKYL